MDKRLQFEIPDADSPGFIRRQRQAMRYREELRVNPSTKTMDAMIAFLLTFVTEPVDRDQARELLFDLSRNEYNRLLSAVNQEDPDFLSSPAVSASTSPPGTEAT